MRISTHVRGRRWRSLLLAGSILPVALLAALVPAPRALARPAAVPTTSRDLGETAHFRHFDVTVRRIAMDPGYYGFLTQLGVCVTSLPPGSADGTTRISWDPWTVRTDRGAHRPAVQEDPPPRTFPAPSRSEARFRVGQCATGWLPFWGVRATDRVRSIDYANSVGDRARWVPQRLVVGQVLTARYFRVTVTDVRRTGSWYGVRARTCVRRLPPGESSVRVSWDPWAASARDDDVEPGTRGRSDVPFHPGYPRQTRLRAGQCVSGWIPFRVGRSARLLGISYANSLDEHARWAS